MAKFLQQIMFAFAFSGGLVMGEENGELEVDETALLQTIQRHVPGDMAALETLLAAAENDALIAHQELLGAFVPLAKVEAGTITTMDTTKSTVKDQFVTHTFVRPFAAVPVVVGVISSAGHQPAEVRIFDVTKEQFKVTVVEPEGHTDGPHLSERVDFMAVVPGVHDMYGLRVEAGLTSTNATVTNSAAFGSSKRSMWETLGWKFDSKPAMFASLNSINNDMDCFESGKHISSPWMTAATSEVSKTGAKISLERSEVADKSIVAEEEDIAWIAVQQGTPTGAEVVFKEKMGTGGRLGFEDAQKGKKAWLSTKEANPICVISKSSRFGNNGGWSRIFERKKNEICVVIDEDMKKNEEREHIQEDVSMIAFPKAFSTCLEAGEMTPRDTAGWNNNYGHGCATYAKSWCANGAFRAGLEWTGSPTQGAGSTCARHMTSTNTNCAMVYNYPADNCVACGKGKVQKHVEMTPHDTAGWNNNYGHTCATYAKSWCENGAFRGGSEWTGSPTQGRGSGCANHMTSTNTNCAMVYNYPADNCVACGKVKVQEVKVQESCCTSATDCRVKMALAARKAVIFANKEKLIVNIKTRILNLEKSLQEQAAKAANSAAAKEREVKRKAARVKARLANRAAVALLKLRKAECAAAFPGKKKIGQLPADMSSLLETFEDVYTFYDCRLRCCIPAESSPSVACASVIFDADAATCFTMSDAYVNPLKGVAGPPVFAAAYERNRGAEAAS